MCSRTSKHKSQSGRRLNTLVEILERFRCQKFEKWFNFDALVATEIHVILCIDDSWITKWWCFPIEFQKYVFELLKTTQGSRFYFDQTEIKIRHFYRKWPNHANICLFDSRPGKNSVINSQNCDLCHENWTGLHGLHRCRWRMLETNVLVTTLRCWWRFWPFLLTSSIF